MLNVEELHVNMMEKLIKKDNHVVSEQVLLLRTLKQPKFMVASLEEEGMESR